MPTSKNKKKQIPISIERVDGDGYHIFCEITVEGKNLRAIIDTGASKTIFGEKAIDTLTKASIVQQNENIAAGIGSEAVSAKIAMIPRIYFGKKQVRSLMVGVMDISHIADHYMELGLKPFDVIIGGDILKAKQCSINYAEKVLIM